mmetsp:Transcript_21164/g.47491  ORF Transcript_21164/g.47491 Transcript_21164/m.47491 type:complete len:122 (-) Transcript_21164:1574-1939(-)
MPPPQAAPSHRGRQAQLQPQRPLQQRRRRTLKPTSPAPCRVCGRAYMDSLARRSRARLLSIPRPPQRLAAAVQARHARSKTLTQCRVIAKAATARTTASGSFHITGTFGDVVPTRTPLITA